MTRFARELPDSDWYRGLKIPHTVIRNIDEKTKQAISGTGGTYAPSAAIIIGGEGLDLQCDLELSGGAVAEPADGKSFAFGDDDYFKFSAPRTRIIHDSPLLLLAKEQLQREARPWGSTTSVPAIRTRRANARLLFPLRIPDGSRLAEVVITFAVGQSHANVPAKLPHARVVRISPDGSFEQHPYPSSSSYDRDGWVYFPTPASGAAWYAGGALQTLTLSYNYALLDPANTSLYAYGLEWIDESGTNAFTDDVGQLLYDFKITVYQDDLRPY